MAEGLNRRDFLTSAGAFAAFSALPAHARPAESPLRVAAPGRARNVILMVSDGMSAGTLTLADTMSQIRTGRRSHWVEWIASGDALRALQDTSAADSIVTDSAAAATAWSAGLRVNNGAINVAPTGEELAPLWLRAKEAGRATGLVTTTRITHATPAAFFANSPTRNDERAIARQLLDRPIDLALGGGASRFDPRWLSEPGAPAVARSRAELTSALGRGERVLGLFAEDHAPYELDRPAEIPSLAEQTHAAISWLDRAPGGFCLLVEGGRVDHAGHANDAASLVHDQLAFDDALRVSIDYAGARDDTLLIAMTDHATANPGLTEYGARGADRFSRLADARRSFEWIVERFRAEPAGARTGARLAELTLEAQGAALAAREVAILDNWLAGGYVDPYDARTKDTAPLGSVLSNHFAVGFISVNHASDHAEVAAAGPGAEALAPVVRNVDLHALVAQAMGLPGAVGARAGGAPR